MTSTEPIVSLSFPFWSKLKSLSSEHKNHFISSLYQLITNDKYQQEFSQLLIDKLLVFITYQGSNIFLGLYKHNSTISVVKVIDYILYQDKSTIKEYLAENEENNITIINIAIEKKELQAWKYLSELLNLDYQFKVKHLGMENNDFWCYFPDGNQQNDYKLLSTHQYQILQRKPHLPTIIMGDRGTGKTTTAIYSALNEAQIIKQKGTEKILYITEDKPSLKELKKISDKYNKYNHIEFCNFLKLNKIIIDKYPLIFTKKFLSQREINFYKFNEQFFKPKKIFAVQAEDLWQEVKYLIKGSSKAIKKSKTIISFNDYLALKKQSIFPENSDFKLIYDLVVQYQQWLESQKYWDILDLTKYLFTQLPDNYLGEYEAIYVDGIEQFSEIQMCLIFKLLKVQSNDNYLPQLFLVGNKEISRFQTDYTWNRTKKLIIDSYHKLPQWDKIRALIEPKEFAHSFIYAEPISKLTSTIANLIGKNTHNASWLKSKQKPLIISEISEEFLAEQHSLNLDCAIIVFDDEQRNKLSNVFAKDSERIINFTELDNLEFEQVLVWKIFSDSNPLQASQDLTERELSAIKYNQIVKCASLARQSIYFYDEHIDKLWADSMINNLVEIGYQTELESLFNREYQHKEIIKIADSFLAKNNYKAYQIAEQIYDRYQKKAGKEKISALIEEIKGNHGKAGDIWNKLGVYEQAISAWNEVDDKLWMAKWSVLNEEEWKQRGNYFEQEKNYQLAKFCFEQANDFEGKLRCLEQDNQWELAGDECKQKELQSQADKYYQLADKYYREHQQISLAIKMWTKLSEWDKVALIWQELEQWEKAGNCWQKFGDMQKAAFCWQKAEKWVEAQKCWQELGNWTELALSYETQENWQLAAQTWLKVIDREKAAICFEKAGMWSEAEQIWSELGYWGFVAICLQQQEKWIEAAEAWNKTNPYELQALCYEKCGDWAKAEQYWLEAKNWRRIIIACEKQGKWLEAAESWENLGEWKNAAKAWQEINEIEKAALCYEEGEYWQEAEECWRKLQQDDRIAITLEKQDKWQLAATIWEELTQWQKAAKAWQEINEIEKAALCYEQGQHWREAEDCWRELQNWAKVKNACKQQGPWQEAADDWLERNQIEQAALCYEKCKDWERAAYYWEQCENWEKLAYACQQISEWDKAASAYLKLEQIERAALCYQKAENWSKAEDCWRKLYKWDYVAITCEYQSKWSQAAKAWLVIEEIEKAGLCYEKCEQWAQAEDCWRKLNDWEKLAIVCEKQELWEEAAQLWYFLKQWQKAAEACLKMDDIQTAVKYYETGGYHQQAEQYRALL